MRRMITFAMLLFACVSMPQADQSRVFAEPKNEPAVQADESVRHLFVAKLLLRRMESVDLTAGQLQAFNRLSRDLRARIDRKRKDVGITKELIKRRDEVYGKLKKTDLSGDALWMTLQKQAELTDAQRDVFRNTQVEYAEFRTAALALLTTEQKKRLPKGKRKSNEASDRAIDKPNIVLIFIDDMGYGDIGPFGNTVNNTPSLDRMAKKGKVRRQFYVANTGCTPSRAALMTETYAARIGMDGQVCFPGGERGLNPDEVTIADMLKANGYATGCFGKWHLGDQPEFLPLKQGFDEYFGIPYSNDMWPGNVRGNPLTNRGPYTPLPVLGQNEVVAYVADGADQSLLCEAVTDSAVDFIRKYKDKPFFCYVPHTYVHAPRYARPKILKKADGNINRANVEEVDTSVGRILDTLRELKLSENTLVIFTSDNGMSMGPLRGGKGGPEYEGHMREPTITWWPGTIPAGVESNGIAVTTDLLPSLARLSGAKVPDDRVTEGKDVLDTLLGKPNAESPHKLHYNEVDGIRRGPLKLVRNRKQKFELYNLTNDIGEKRNLAKQRPELVRELSEMLRVHAANVAKDTRPAAFVESGAAKPLTF